VPACSQPKQGEAAAADMDNVKLAREVLPKVLADWTPENTYNFDETGLYWRRQPTRVLSRGRQSGTKLAKERMTIGLACNAAGTHKLKAAVIHTAKEPRAFKQGGRFPVNDYVSWHSNSTAWMTGQVFSQLMHAFNRQFKLAKRKVIMLMNNAATHTVAGGKTTTLHGLKAIELSNLTIVFLPPNTTSHVQPLDQGIIAAFKLRYRKQLVRWILAAYDAEDDTTDLSTVKPNARQAVLWLHQAWDEITPTTIQNCWRKCGLAPTEWHAAAAGEPLATHSKNMGVLQFSFHSSPENQPHPCLPACHCCCVQKQYCNHPCFC